MAAERVYVALLRGINVGGKNIVPMKGLAEVFEGAGCSGVRTYIQSGNVVFGASAATAKRVPGAVSAAVDERFGVRAPVVLRSAEEMQKIASGNPFVQAGEDEKLLHVVFLQEAASAKVASGLDPARSPGDSFRVRPMKGAVTEVYLCLPAGVARTKFTSAYLDKALGTVCTVRNWRTVLALGRLVQ